MPYHALFSATMFIAPTAGELEDFRPEAVVLHAPAFEADPEEDGTRRGKDRAFYPRWQAEAAMVSAVLGTEV